MKRNTQNWLLINESNDVEKLKETNRKLREQKEAGLIDFFGGIKYFKESVTKSYKYIGEEHKEDISIILFKTEVYKHVAQNQITLF
jgi:hypothetical protein